MSNPQCAPLLSTTNTTAMTMDSEFASQLWLLLSFVPKIWNMIEFATLIFICTIILASILVASSTFSGTASNRKRRKRRKPPDKFMKSKLRQALIWQATFCYLPSLADAFNPQFNKLFDRHLIVKSVERSHKEATTDRDPSTRGPDPRKTLLTGDLNSNDPDPDACPRETIPQRDPSIIYAALERSLGTRDSHRKQEHSSLQETSRQEGTRNFSDRETGISSI